MYHFGDRDNTLPPEAIEKIRLALPQGQYFIYPADHGFNCDQRASFDEPAAKLARERTLGFFAQHLGGPQNSAQGKAPRDAWDDA
jgi:carboxymethylenebutenolidase